MKNILIKSGGYYETPGIAVAGAINDIHDFNVGQFHKSEMTFRLDLVNGEYLIYLSHPGQQGNGFTQMVDMDFLTREANKVGFAYFGVVSGDKATLTNAEMLRMMGVVTIAADGQFVNAATGEALPGNNILPILYCVKITDDTFAVVLSSLTRIDTFLANDEDGLIQANDGFNTIVVNDGASMRDQFVDIQFDGIEKAFRNNDLVTGYAVYVKRGQQFMLDVFKKAPFVTDTMKTALQPKVDSNFSCEVEDGTIVVSVPEDATHGWLSVELPVTPLYKEVSSREIKEMITLDFMVFVL